MSELCNAFKSKIVSLEISEKLQEGSWRFQSAILKSMGSKWLSLPLRDTTRTGFPMDTIHTQRSTGKEVRIRLILQWLILFSRNLFVPLCLRIITVHIICPYYWWDLLFHFKIEHRRLTYPLKFPYQKKIIPFTEILAHDWFMESIICRASIMRGFLLNEFLGLQWFKKNSIKRYFKN